MNLDSCKGSWEMWPLSRWPSSQVRFGVSLTEDEEVNGFRKTTSCPIKNKMSLFSEEGNQHI